MRFDELLDPEVAAVLDTVPRLDLTDLPRARAEREQLAAVGRGRWAPSGRGGPEGEHNPGPPGDPAVRLRVHRPLGRPTGAALLWIHGGGHVLGSADQD